jgi:hypothetical protein
MVASMERSRGGEIIEDTGIPAAIEGPTVSNPSFHMRLRRAFAVYGGFWGRYKVDAGARTITAHAEGALSP